MKTGNGKIRIKAINGDQLDPREHLLHPNPR